MSQLDEKPSFLVNSINRIDRANSTSSSFNYQLDIKPNSNFDSVALVSAHIPKSYYLVSTGNVFNLIEMGFPAVTIQLPPGDYNYQNLPIVLGNTLTTLSPNGWTYTCSLPNILTQPDTGLMTTTVTGNGGSQPSFQFLADNRDEIHHVLGFLVGVTYPFVADGLTSIQPINLERTQFITIKSNIAINGGNYNQDTQILARISSAEENLNVIAFKLALLDDGSRILANNNTNVFNFSLHDSHDRLIDLNGREWTCNLLLYKESEVNKSLKQIIINTEKKK